MDKTTSSQLEHMKFGKKMVFGEGDSHHAVLAHHLQMMRDNIVKKVEKRESALKADHEFLDRVSAEIAIRDQNQAYS